MITRFCSPELNGFFEKLDSFIESLVATKPYYAVRFLGGLLFLSGMLIMAWNVWKTFASKEMKPIPASEPADWGAHA